MTPEAQAFYTRNAFHFTHQYFIPEAEAFFTKYILIILHQTGIHQKKFCTKSLYTMRSSLRHKPFTPESRSLLHQQLLTPPHHTKQERNTHKQRNPGAQNDTETMQVQQHPGMQNTKSTHIRGTPGLQNTSSAILAFKTNVRQGHMTNCATQNAKRIHYSSATVKVNPSMIRIGYVTLIQQHSTMLNTMRITDLTQLWDAIRIR